MSRTAKRGRPSKKSRSSNNGEVEGEDVSEDYCFECKDGGDLILCDFKGCNKAYHPECVGKEPTTSEAGEQWTCNWHHCFVCKRSSKYRCHCCTKAVCKPCIKVANFVPVSDIKGFCNNCLKLALLVEENLDVDSDGGKVDFEDRDTFEFLFKDYWEILKVKEGLNLEILRNANIQLKKVELCSDKLFECEEEDNDFSDEMDENMESQNTLMKDLDHGLLCMKKIRRKLKPKKREFLGWASRNLVEFLSSIGKDTSKALSQYEVHDIIKAYIHENKLFHPEKKKKVLCDAKLHKFFGRKAVNRNKIFDMLEPHFAENQEQSDDESSYDSEEDDEILKHGKRKRRIDLDGKAYKIDKVFKTPQSCFAAITTKNIKLVYLRKSLVEHLLKDPETFNGKVIGSFVRVKPDPNDYFQRNVYQLGQVTGVKNLLGVDECGKEVTLQVLNVKKDVPISLLSDNDFSEEECEDLNKKMKEGLLKKLTIVELEEKAKSLHEDVTKHWIDGELALLNKLIDRANEKGWRRDLFEYLERRQLLQTPKERTRLLEEVPKVIPEEAEVEFTLSDSPKDEKSGEDDFPKSVVDSKSENLHGLEEKKLSSKFVLETDTAGDSTVCHLKAGTMERKGLSGTEDGNDDVFSGKNAGKTTEKEAEGIVSSSAEQENKEQHKLMQLEAGSTKKTSAGVLNENDPDRGVGVSSSKIELIDLDNDDNIDEDPGSMVFGDPGSEVWHYVDPSGEKQGPFKMTMLKKWYEDNYFKSDFKVWKTGQNEEEAILLVDALAQIFPKNRKHKQN